MSLDQSNRGDKWSQGLHEVQYFDFLDFCNGQIAAPLPNKDPGPLNITFGSYMPITFFISEFTT